MSCKPPPKNSKRARGHLKERRCVEDRGTDALTKENAKMDGRHRYFQDFINSDHLKQTFDNFSLAYGIALSTKQVNPLENCEILRCWSLPLSTRSFDERCGWSSLSDPFTTGIRSAVIARAPIQADQTCFAIQTSASKPFRAGL